MKTYVPKHRERPNNTGHLSRFAVSKFRSIWDRMNIKQIIERILTDIVKIEALAFFPQGKQIFSEIYHEDKQTTTHDSS